MKKLNSKALDYHAFPQPGKLSVGASKKCDTAEDLSLAYTPGVAEPVLEIVKDLANNKSNPFTALWITHRLEELSYADGVAEMKNGKLSDWQKPLNFQYN